MLNPIADIPTWLRVYSMFNSCQLQTVAFMAQKRKTVRNHSVQRWDLNHQTVGFYQQVVNMHKAHCIVPFSSPTAEGNCCQNLLVNASFGYVFRIFFRGKTQAPLPFTVHPFPIQLCAKKRKHRSLQVCLSRTP